MLLRMRGPLALSPEQVKRLEALAEAPMPKIDRAGQLRAKAELVDAMQGDGNLAAARAAMDKMAKLRTDRMFAGLKARQDARAVLTPAQKSKVDNLRQRLGARAGKGRMRQRQGGMMPGGMMRGGMMPGGMMRGGMMPRGPGARNAMPNAGGARREIIEERIIRGPNGEERVIRQGAPRPPVPPA
jgi:Spy/CpxP family protein refolding chaperone